ncbi:hypothetical protein EST38_g9152 [Candolleomyces aberdarensis]|uniref:Reverse transcriptase domain-containing protein n=1 Tax=Candolleomyces aberdarensis TaxID=2316362 RepID=A0A4V1Q2Y4_9AGAR|nr:hypothetical protein EST38_g9152 [Candolleomyces aberdarensis]
MSVENHKVFRAAVKAAKRKFFNEHIEEIATTNKRPWDLMDWVKECKNPPCKAIQFNDIFITVANRCIESGHWPKHFKESMSVIISKLNKPSYSTPKVFRPIVLLNTPGKLIEKMISNRFQHNMIKYDLVNANQMALH